MVQEDQSVLEEMRETSTIGWHKLISKELLRFLSWYDSSIDYFEVNIQRGEENADEMAKMYFHAAFADRVGKWIGGLAAITLLQVFIFYFYPSSFSLQAFGLSIDILGAVILATGLLRGLEGMKRDTKVYGAQVGSSFSSKSLSSEARDTVDGVFGVFYLIIGFTIQIVSLYL